MQTGIRGSHLQEVPDSVHFAIESSFMEAGTIGAGQLLVDIKSVPDQETDDLIVALFRSKQEGSVRHV